MRDDLDEAAGDGVALAVEEDAVLTARRGIEGGLDALPAEELRGVGEEAEDDFGTRLDVQIALDLEGGFGRHRGRLGGGWPSARRAWRSSSSACAFRRARPWSQNASMNVRSSARPSGRAR